jgi:(p)ppGpp synthase/HD superfamily hydrolase
LTSGRRPNIKAKAKLPAMLSNRFYDAFMFAAQKHAQQIRKGTQVPYISHLMGVCSLVMEAGGDEDLAIAGLLHDVVEDCGGKRTLGQVRRLFGERVAHVVEGCTDSYSIPKPPWRQRKIEYLKRLRSADDDIRLVSAADKLYNARSILVDYKECGELVWQRFKGGRNGTLWYYQAVSDELGGPRSNRLANELAQVVAELQQQVSTGRSSRPAPHSNRRS